MIDLTSSAMACALLLLLALLMILLKRELLDPANADEPCSCMEANYCPRHGNTLPDEY